MSADPSIDIDTLIVACGAVALSTWTAIASLRARREQSKTSREKAEDEAFLRVQQMYTTALKTQGDELATANNRIAEQNRRIHDLEELMIHQRGERRGNFGGRTSPPQAQAPSCDDA